MLVFIAPTQFLCHYLNVSMRHSIGEKGSRTPHNRGGIWQATLVRGNLDRTSEGGGHGNSVTWATRNEYINHEMFQVPASDWLINPGSPIIQTTWSTDHSLNPQLNWTKITGSMCKNPTGEQPLVFNVVQLQQFIMVSCGSVSIASDYRLDGRASIPGKKGLFL
jgi:hypothetical protein